MPKGFDTTVNCTNSAQQIKNAGYDFVGRYLSSHGWKVISPTEATALQNAGLSIVLVYEDAPTSDTYFSNGRGQADGARAAQQAQILGAPNGTTIYFAVDYDASDSDIQGVITQYFQGVSLAFRNFQAVNNIVYRTGVYGSGATCAAITSAVLATQAWLADATGWRGHATFTTWAISQGLPEKVLGMSVDPDSAVGDYGAIPPLAPVA
jgi:hypothetical protein